MCTKITLLLIATLAIFIALTSQEKTYNPPKYVCQEGQLICGVDNQFNLTK